MAMIYIVEDDENIREIEMFALKNAGYEVQGFECASDFYARLKEKVPALVLLDIMLPDEDGLSIVKKLRHAADTRKLPIIMATAKTTELDKVKGLDIGADDYITKPFNPLELIARVKPQLRRYVNLGSMEIKKGVFKTGGLEVDDEQKTVTVDGQPIVMTPTEFGILKLLTENAGKVFSMEQIYESVWNEPAYNPENTVAVHVRRIREKIEINPKNPKYLKVVWGIGYKIEKI